MGNHNLYQDAMFEVFESYSGESGQSEWENQLFLGDNLLVMYYLVEKYEGRIKLIYIDPPFATGNQFFYTHQLGESQSVTSEAYKDSWGGIQSYIEMMEERLRLMHRLLSDDGSIILHCDYRTSPYISVLMDEIFGCGDRSGKKNQKGFRSEIVWLYGLGGSSSHCYPRKHDTLLWYSKSDVWYFDPPMIPATSQRMKGMQKKCPDYWFIPTINNMAKERCGYPTQKPLALLERIVKAHSKEGDLVADFFCGSGTTLICAERLKRRWIGCDESPLAIHITCKRLLETEKLHQFQILHRRQHRFMRSSRIYNQGRLFKIIDLFEATPIESTTYVMGKKGDILVSAQEFIDHNTVKICLEKCIAIGCHELHLFGFDWDFSLRISVRGCNGTLWHKKAEEMGIKLIFYEIPPTLDLQTSKGKFLIEIPYIEIALINTSDTFTVAIERFFRPNNLVPKTVSDQIKDWTQFIDGWGVDWCYDGKVFRPSWITFRKRKQEYLTMTSPPYLVREKETVVLVKVIDIFGQSAYQTMHLVVK